MPTEGEIVGGRLRILDQIAEGDLGAVHQAEDTDTQEIFTLRLFTQKPAADGPLMSLLTQDAERLEKLRHPNIMPVGEIGETHDGKLYAVRKFVEGRNLEDVIRLEGPLSLARACGIGRQIASALEAAHNAGILHGDLKPSNILLVEENWKEIVKVLGFGTFALKQDRFINIARLALQDSSSLAGSSQYLSPERAIGTEPDTLDGRSDIYSVGVILYEMLSAETPFHGNNAMEVLLAHVFEEPRPLSGRPELEIPETLDTLVMRCLAKKRNDRPSSATVLVDQLRAWEEYQPASPAAEKAEPPPRPASEPFPFPPLSSPEAEPISQPSLRSGADVPEASPPSPEEEPVSRLPFHFAPTIEPEDLAPTVEIPIRSAFGKPLENPEQELFRPPAAQPHDWPETPAEAAASSDPNLDVPLTRPEPGKDAPGWDSLTARKPEREAQPPAPQIESAPEAEHRKEEPARPAATPSTERDLSPSGLGFPGLSFDQNSTTPVTSQTGWSWAPTEAPEKKLKESANAAADFAQGFNGKPEVPSSGISGRTADPPVPPAGKAPGNSKVPPAPSRISAPRTPAAALPDQLVFADTGKARDFTPRRPDPPATESFVLDLAPQGAREKSEGVNANVGEMSLGDRVPLNFQDAKATTPSRDAGSIIFAQPAATVGTSPGDIQSRHSARLAAAIVILLLICAGAGWLYFTGRSYWFRPQFVVSKVSSLLSSQPPESAAPGPSQNGSSSAPLTSSATVQPPVTANRAQSPPASSSASTPQSQSGATSPPVTSPGKAASTPARHAPLEALSPAGIPRSAESALASPIQKEAGSLHPQAGDSAAVEDAVRRGNYYFLLGRYNAAIAVYDAALKQNPANPKLLEEIARAKRAKAAEAEFLGH